jgi:nitrous oxidase accessory protein NosD
VTRPLPVLPFATLLAPVLMLSATPTRAAESYDNCAGTVASLPAVIDTQGVWCLKKDLATLSVAGTAITVTKPNVTIDCNGFKLGGLGAGTATTTIGIDGSGTSNLTVRNCNIRGFATGVLVDDTSGGGHLIEDNRFEANTFFGIDVFGDGTLIRRNQVLDTGGSTAGLDPNRIAGIRLIGDGDVLDNAVRGVDSTGTNAFAYGILVTEATAGAVVGNRVSGLLAGAAAAEYAIRPLSSNGLAIRDNDLVGPGAYAMRCSIGGTVNVAIGNSMTGFTDDFGTCPDGGGNVSY